jgi:hypothetical protein
MARDCPECRAPVDGMSCRACGWSEVQTSSGVPVDPRRFHCVDVYRGQQCAKLAPYSQSTLGSEQWFCFDHFPPFRTWNKGEKSPPTPNFRAVAAKYKPIDVEAIAERLAIQRESA